MQYVYCILTMDRASFSVFRALHIFNFKSLNIPCLCSALIKSLNSQHKLSIRWADVCQRWFGILHNCLSNVIEFQLIFKKYSTSGCRSNNINTNESIWERRCNGILLHTPFVHNNIYW